MILFKSVKYKNFLSTGKNFTHIQLDRAPTTLIVGHNGAGKSTILDAISFGLFGKPHRNITKGQLINSINNKDCVVEVEFEIGNHKFKVVRGIKPNIFEIWQNDKMIDQSAAVKDYQKFLESNILKLNHKSFHQVVVLGSSSFIPFMQLPTGARRGVIEDLLDINIFTKMNVLLKEKVAKIKEEIKDVTYNVDLIKEKISLQRKYLKDVTDLNEEQVRIRNEKILTIRAQVAELQSSNGVSSQYIEEYQEDASREMAKALKKQSKMIEYGAQFKEKMRSIAKEAQFFSEHDQCPTCEQGLEAEFKESKVEQAKVKAKELQEVMNKAEKEISAVNSEIQRLEDIHEKIRSAQNDINGNNREIDRLQEEIKTLEQEIHSMNVGDGDVKVIREGLESLIADRDTLTERKLELLDDKTYSEACAEMLKDTGIKTKVIKQYLPVMNKLINNYLQVLDFFVSFNLDESFNEEIKSRHRDKFNYSSFSEGEKQRIDLALLFAWRQIAKMKNSVSTNLLLLDETFDSSLDSDGVDNLLKILGTLEDDTNVFVISHKRDELDGKFRSKIEFTKERNFSKMVVA